MPCLMLTKYRLEDHSDAASLYLDFTAKLQETRREIEAFGAPRNPQDSYVSQTGSELPTRLWMPHLRRGKFNGRGRGSHRGHRRAAEPTGDIKLRLGQASECFINGEYGEAKKIASEVIRINAETIEAWNILSTILHELGDIDKSVMALMYAAHLQPRDVGGWLNCAKYCLEETGKHRSKYLQSAAFCYGAALRSEPKNIEARLGKAKTYTERGPFVGAIAEYKRIRKQVPYNLEVVRSLAAAYFDHEEAEMARDLYKEVIDYFRSFSDTPDDALTWSDVNSYVFLHGFLGDHETAIKEVKTLARWLLSRDVETFWDDITIDDREWDRGDSRRVNVPGFVVDKFPSSTYGEGLPLELRAKLALNRLALEHYEEAMVATCPFSLSSTQ
jgi:general transcription factor 3C polypeptide 3 (transcription factor C subunit 4)